MNQILYFQKKGAIHYYKKKLKVITSSTKKIHRIKNIYVQNLDSHVFKDT